MIRFLIFITAVAVLCSGCTGANSQLRADYRSHMMKGQRYVSADKYDQSVKEFTEALKLGAQMRETMLPTVMLGEAYIRGNEIGKAEKISYEAIGSWPNESCVWELAGKVDLKRNRLKNAEDSFAKALSFATTKEDKKRIESLLSLTRGLKSYAQANIQSTREHFAGIEDSGLARQTKTNAKAILGIEQGK